MSIIKITAVSYLNTLPFIHGINNSGFLKENSIIELDYPSKCAEKLITYKSDIGLIPVAAIPDSVEFSIITDYCIGAVGKVKSVLLVSNEPMAKLEKVVLDYQSRTSVTLVKVLAGELWKISPEWTKGDTGYEKTIDKNIGGVIIGDRAIALRSGFRYVYDLSEEWQKLTGLPFVFACWVANKHISDQFVNEMNKAFRYGVTHINDIKSDLINQEDLMDYLNNCLSFDLNETKVRSMNLFKQYVQKLS